MNIIILFFILKYCVSNTLLKLLKINYSDENYIFKNLNFLMCFFILSNKNESRTKQEDNLFEIIFKVKRWKAMQWSEIFHHKICKYLNDRGEKVLFFYKGG